MNTLFLLAGLSLTCPAPEIVNKTGTWTKMDQATYVRAQTRCGHYFKVSPCLKVLKKLEERRYHAVCGTSDMGNLL